VEAGVEAQKEALGGENGRAREQVMAKEAEAKTSGKVAVTETKVQNETKVPTNTETKVEPEARVQTNTEAKMETEAQVQTKETIEVKTKLWLTVRVAFSQRQNGSGKRLATPINTAPSKTAPEEVEIRKEERKQLQLQALACLLTIAQTQPQQAGVLIA